MTRAFRSTRRRFVKRTAALAAGASLFGPWVQLARAQTKELKVGFLLPLTGSFAEAGQLNKLAVEMAVEEINKAGGVRSLGGAKIVPVFANSTSVDEANTETNRLISRERVVGIVGAYSSGATISSTVIAERASVPYLVPNALADEITGRGLKYVFKTVPHFSQFATNAAEMVLRLSEDAKRPVQTCCLVRENNFFGNVVGREFARFMPGYKLQILKDNIFPTNPTSFEDVILSLRKDSPDVVFAAGEPSSITLLFRQLAELKYWPKLGWVGLGGGYSNPITWGNLSKLADGLIVVNDWFPEIKLSGAKEANERFRKRTGKDLLGNSNTTYAGVHIFKAALEKAGSTDGPKIRDALATLDLVEGPQTFMYPRVKFDDTGFMPRTTLVGAQVRNGQARVIWPSEFQVAKPIWPVPDWSTRA